MNDESNDCVYVMKWYSETSEETNEENNDCVYMMKGYSETSEDI
jgi:hypothetical protein